MKLIYLDNNATTEVDKDVAETAYSVLKDHFGNASSLYPIGIESNGMINESRNIIRTQLGAEQNDEIIFTSCASESNNAVFFSAINSFPDKKHIIISAVEHMSVIQCAEYWEKMGYDVSIIGVDKTGNIDFESFIRCIRKDTLLVSIMLANNETGVIFPIKKLVEELKKRAPEALFHTDAVQAIGKIPVDVKKLGVDFLSLSGHKFHAPKGIGVLYIKNGTPFYPFIMGGHQEKGLRAGTENLANIVALGCAAKKIPDLIEKNTKKVVFRKYIEDSLKELSDIYIIGEGANRLPNTINVSAKNINGTQVLLKLAKEGICVSSGSACNSVSEEPSHVLKAMNVPDEFLRSIRISLSSHTNGDEVKEFLSNYKSIIIKERNRHGYN